MHEYLSVCWACILSVYLSLQPLLLWANIRQPMKSHLVNTQEHLVLSGDFKNTICQPTESLRTACRPKNLSRSVKTKLGLKGL